MHKRVLLMALAAVAVIALAVAIPLYLVGSSPGISPSESQIVLKGHGVLVLTDPDGSIETREFDNLIVAAGIDAIAAAVGNPTQPDNFDYIAVGEDNTAPAAGNTALGSEIAATGRKIGTYSHTAGTNTWKIVVTFAPGEATGSIKESGVLNAATGGTLLCRQTFLEVNKGANDTLEITWEFTLT